MSLNTIKFNTSDITLLFKNSLVEVRLEKENLPHATINAEPAAIGWKFLGENKKKTLIVVNYQATENIPDKQLSFLTKLLAACNLNLGDVAILNFHTYKSSDFDNIFHQFKPGVVLLFDTEPAEFGLPMIFPQFQVQRYKDVVFVSSPSLEIIEPDKTLKGKLWVCLKKIFNL